MLDAEKALRRAERERAARKIAEQLLEEKSSALFLANEQLEKSRADLERRVLQRTAELAVATELLRGAAEQSQLANKAKSDFLARMSHEIRTPMNGIVGLTELLLGTSLSQVQNDYLNMIQTSANALLEIINDILDFSRIEAGKMEISSTEFSLRETLIQVSRSLAVRAEQKGLEFLLKVESDVPAIVSGDPQRLSQILINLIGNAIKFTPSGNVGLCVSVDEFLNDFCVVRMSVSDTGIGIPLEKQQLIFEPFDQADGTTSRHFGGSGLGLSISKQLVEIMGGTLSVSSMMHHGSTFTVTISLKVVRRFETIDSAKLNALRGKRCLIVDANREQRTAVQKIVDSWKCRSTVAGSAVEAKLCMHEATRKGQPFDIVFISTRLPDASAAALISAMDQYEKSPRAILIRTGSDAALAEYQFGNSFQNSVQFSIARPFLPHELLDVAFRAMTGHSSAAFVQKNAPQQPEPDKQRFRILLVDDMPVNRAVAHGMLTKFGHQVQCAEDGLEAVRLAQEVPFDLVFMDIQMPEMDGIAAASIIRQLEDLTVPRLPLIALTANAFADDRQKYLAAGFDDYLSKPFVQDQLLEMVHRWGHQKRSALSAVIIPIPDSTPSVSFVAPKNQSGSGSFEPSESVKVQPSNSDTLMRFDSAFVMRQVGDSLELLQQIAVIYETSLAERSEVLHKAIVVEDSAAIESVSHALKGTLGSLGGVKAAQSARLLEAAAKEKRTKEFETLAATLLEDAEILKSELNAFLQSHCDVSIASRED